MEANSPHGHCATRGELAQQETRWVRGLHAVERRTLDRVDRSFRWMLGGFLATLLAIIGFLVTVLAAQSRSWNLLIGTHIPRSK